jgi:exonuclease SbcC
MIPRKLALQNFMCYREGLPPLEFDGMSIACLAGENGAGKSALLDAITWALWGEARLKSDDDLVALGATEMMVELEFTLDGQDYRVIRRRIRGKRGGQSQLDFQVRDGNEWRSLTPGGIRETQQLIIRTLRMDYDMFANSAYLRQGRADEFTRKEPAKRKQVLADILGLSLYEELESRAKERARGIEGQIRGLEGQIGELRRQAERYDLLVDEVRAAEERVTDALARAEAARQALEEATASVQKLEQVRTIRDNLHTQIQRRRREREDQAQWLDRQIETQKRAESWIARRAEIEEGIRLLRAAEAERDRLAALRDEYDHLQSRRAALAQALANAEHAIRSDLRVAETQVQTLRERAARRPKLAAELQRLAAQLAEHPPIAEALSAARTRRTTLTERLRRVNELLRRRTELESDIKLKHDSLVATREEQKRTLRTLAEQLKHEARWRTELAEATAERARASNRKPPTSILCATTSAPLPKRSAPSAPNAKRSKSRAIRSTRNCACSVPISKFARSARANWDTMALRTSRRSTNANVRRCASSMRLQNAKPITWKRTSNVCATTFAPSRRVSTPSPTCRDALRALKANWQNVTSAASSRSRRNACTTMWRCAC